MAYSDEDKKEIWESILAELMTGRSLRSILRDPGMPNRDTVYRWIVFDKDKSDQYARATEIRADEIFDELINISDDSGDDIITLDNGKDVINHKVILRDRLRIDTRKWILARMNPKKYGDRIEVDQRNITKEVPTFIFKKLNDSK